MTLPGPIEVGKELWIYAAKGNEKDLRWPGPGAKGRTL
jgi:hypothetical protein